MQSFQVVEQIEFLREVLKSQENNEFISFLSTLNTRREILESSGINILDAENNTTDVSRFVSEHRNTVSKITEEIKKSLRPGSVFASIRKLGNIFNKFEQGLNQKEDGLSNIKYQLDSFETVYEEFIQEYSCHVTMKLANAGTDLFHSLKSIEDIFSAIWMSLQNNYDFEDSLGSLSLLLDAGSTYRDFVRKLESIQNIYSKLCSLAIIKEEDFPLKIVKIESGSLFVKIFGEPRVIGLMISLIQDTIGFVYRTKTTEGKIESITQRKVALDSLIEMRKNLLAAGLSVEELDKELNQSAVFIARELNYLFAGESKININGEILQLPNNDNRQNLLESPKQYLIEGTKDNSKQDE